MDESKKEESKKIEDKREESQKSADKGESCRKCFIITPIGDAASDTFRMAKGVIESVIKPLLSIYGYDDIKPSYEINQTGMINTQIINRILDDDLVIANLTGNNPNVMYELCLRHATAKPIIHICQYGTNLPFDIKDNRTIFYKNDMLGAQELKEQMDLFVREIDYSKEYIDNPIYNAQRMGRLIKEVPKESENRVEVELLQNILEQVNNLYLSKNSNDINKQKEHIGCRYFRVHVDKTGLNGNQAKEISEMIINHLKGLRGISIGRCNIDETIKIDFSVPSNHPRKYISMALEEVENKYNVEISIEEFGW